MDSGLVRLLIVAALFLLLASDSFIVKKLTSAFHNDSAETEKKVTPKHTYKDSEGRIVKVDLMNIITNSCLPKVVCEMNAMPKDKLSEPEKRLLSYISDTTMTTTAEVTSKYHFAAHMGQLIAGVDGTGCYNFYPTCPFNVVEVLNLVKANKFLEQQDSKLPPH